MAIHDAGMFSVKEINRLKILQDVIDRNLRPGQAAEILDSASLYLDECIENYLNGLDRLCFCIIKEYFDNDEMKIEYRHVINDAVKENPTYFQQASKHRNIKKIHEKWADS